MPKVKAKNTITDSQRTLTKDVGSIMEILITGGCGFSKRDMLYLEYLYMKDIVGLPNKQDP